MTENTQGFGEIISDLGSFLLEMLVSAIWGLYMLFAFIFTKISEFFEGLNIPLLPSRSKILRYDWISGTLLILFISYVLVINISAFNLFRKDKLKSKKQNQKNKNDGNRYDRISERRLLRRCFFGGALGGYLGIKICRHKTLKPKFTVGVTVMLVLQLLLFSFVFGFFGFWLYFS